MIFGSGAGRCVTDFLLSNRNPDAGDRDISISGGIWDGNNVNNPRGGEGDRNAFTGALINMKNVDGFVLEHAVLKDSTAYFTRFTRVRNFRVERIRFEMTHVTRNQDGVHCCGHCENGHIHDISATGRYTTGDDLVALNADDGLLRSELLGAEAGPIRNLQISNIRAEDCHSLIRLASVWSEISNLDIRGVYGGCRHYALNADALRYCRLPLFDPADSAYAKGVGLLKNIRLADAEVYSTSNNPVPLFCLESRMDGFELHRIARRQAHDTNPDAPLVAIRNVIQNRVCAEYRHIDSGAVPPLGESQFVAGRPKMVRGDNAGCPVHAMEICTDELAFLAVGAPWLQKLPKKNCRIGFPPTHGLDLPVGND